MRSLLSYSLICKLIIHQSVSYGIFCSKTCKVVIAYIDSIEKNYRAKVIKYIEKYYDDTVTLFPDLVKKFNENKIFKEVPDMKQKKISDFVNFGDEAEYYEMVMCEREDFLAKHGVVI